MNMIAAILFFVAFVYAGIIRLRDLGQRERCLRSVTECLLHIRNSIDRTNAALPELFSLLSQQCTGQAGAFFEMLKNETARIGEKSFTEIWCGVIPTAFPELLETEYDALSRLGCILGSCDCQTQVREINNCEAVFNSALGIFRQDLPQRKKLTLGLAATAGAFAAILLI